MSSRWQDVFRQIGVAGSYLLLAKASMAFTARGDVASLMWFPSGLALAVLLVGGRKYWPGIWGGAYLSSIIAGHAVPVAIIVAAGYVLEPLFATWLLTRAGSFDPSFRRKNDSLQLLLAGIASPWVSGFMAVVAMLAAGELATREVPIALLQWWMGGMFGIVLVTPMILIWRRPQMHWFRRERATEFMALFGLAFVCGQAVFLGWFRNFGGTYAEEYLMFIFVTWAGVRFGRHGVQLVILLVLAQAWMGMLLGSGDFGSDMSRVGMVKFWVYFVELTAIGIALATVIREKNDTRDIVSESEERFRSMFRKHSSVMLLIDPVSGQIVDANRAAADFYGYSEEALRNMRMSQINSLSAEEATIALRRALDEEQKRFTLSHNLHSGETRIVDVHSSPIEVAGRTLLFSIVMDITESRKMEEELEKRANTDLLTGLPNRRRFMELAEQELARSLRYEGPFTLLLMDVDHFKSINDTHGHKGGDIALQALAEQCCSTLREVDVTGRFGGEEFAIILPETDGVQGLEVAERLRQEIAAMSVPVEQGARLQMTVSIGLVTRHESEIDIDELLQQADKALYCAKQSGRNRVCVFGEAAALGVEPLFAPDAG